MAKRKVKSETTAKRNGRPPTFETADELKAAIDLYLADAGMPNKAGLCVALGISRDTYSEYRKKFPDTIKRADQIIEDIWVQRLPQKNATGVIFYLKAAMGWKDQQNVDITTKGEKLTITGMTISKA